MFKVFLLLVVLVRGGLGGDLAFRSSPQPRNWPCPNDVDITPCVCTVDEEFDLFMDCSLVNSEEQLAKIFQKYMPFNGFKVFNMTRTKPSPAFTRLPSGVFGSATFQHVLITGTYLLTIEEGALINSRETLLILELQNNGITTFPYETLPLFTHLWHFNLAYNNIQALPDIVSDSVRTLSLAGNLGISLTSSTLSQATMLEYLNLDDMFLKNIPPNVFSRLENIHTLKLSRNDFIGTLIDHFVNNPDNTLDFLDLHDNKIADIHHRAIRGLHESATVNFRDNMIERLRQEKWEAILEQVNRDNAIDLRDNSLECGCDVYWLVLNSTLLMRIHEETLCRSGSYLHDLPLDYFLENCPDGPDT